MKTKLFSFVIGIFVLSIIDANAMPTQWHDYDQTTRNQAIVKVACQYVNNYVDLSCKEWVKTVVQIASDNAVNIPETVALGFYWADHPYVSGRCGYIEGANLGEIVQMKLNDGTFHTIIVINVTQQGITFIGNNWCDGGCGIVCFWYINFTNFYEQVSAFTIHCIL